MKTKPVLWMVALTLAGFASSAASGASYSTTATTLDGGGIRTTSASYANDGSLGGFGGVVTANSPQEVARTGYAGQLYEVTGLTLTAASTNLNEATSMPLSAVQYLDDGTVSSVSSLAQWSCTGPLAGVDAAGIVTAGNVSQNTSATVQARLEGWSASLNLMVLDVVVPVLPPGYNQIAGLRMSGGNMRLSFVGFAGTNYILDRSFSLSPANWIPQVTNPADINGVLVFTNTPDTSTNNFWRIRSVP